MIQQLYSYKKIEWKKFCDLFLETASRLLFISAEVDIEDFKLLRNLLPTFMIHYWYMENLCLQAMNAAPFSQTACY